MASRTYRSVVRERAAAATRAAVVAAASEVFAESGYSATTMTEIARRAEVGVNTVFTKFGTKAGLLAEVLSTIATSDTAETAVAEIQTALSGSDVIDRLATGIRRNTQPSYALVGVALTSSSEDPVIADALDSAIAGYRTRIADAVDRIDALDDLRPGISRANATDVLWFYLGITAWRVLVDQGWSWSRTQRFLTQQAKSALL